VLFAGETIGEDEIKRILAQVHPTTDTEQPADG
jgi:hypothetical protein